MHLWVKCSPFFFYWFPWELLSLQGEVVAVGPGAKNDDGKISAMDVKVGDIVLFGKWSGTEVKIDGKEYSIMKESDIMGITTK